jgi:hypothetical protein
VKADVQAHVNTRDWVTFNALFAADWLLGPSKVGKVLPRRWGNIQRRMLDKMSTSAEGKALAVERRRDLTPEEFREGYFIPGRPVVLEGAASAWPAIRKWSPEYFVERCGREEVTVLDGRNWTVNAGRDGEAVSTSESSITVAELLQNVQHSGAWYGAFLDLLDQRADLRADLDLTFVRRFGHTNLRLPWQRNILAKLYVGGPQTATSFHCAGVSNLYVQVYGRKKWVLISPRFTPFMYPALSKGLNWQSRVDFRNPDYGSCPLYRYVDRYECVLEPGDVLWNPPFVWHGVLNMTESIAVSLWWTNVTRAFANNTVLSALTLCGRPNPIALQFGFSREPAEKTSHFSVHLNR